MKKLKTNKEYTKATHLEYKNICKMKNLRLIKKIQEFLLY